MLALVENNIRLNSNNRMHSHWPPSHIGPTENNRLSIVQSAIIVLISVIILSTIVLAVDSRDLIEIKSMAAQWKNHKQTDTNNDSLIRLQAKSNQHNRDDRDYSHRSNIEFGTKSLAPSSNHLTYFEQILKKNGSINSGQQSTIDSKQLQARNYLASTGDNYNRNEGERQKLFAPRKSLLEKILRQYYSEISGRNTKGQRPTIIESRIVSKRHKEMAPDASQAPALSERLLPIIWTTAASAAPKRNAPEDHYLSSVEQYAQNPFDFITNDATTNNIKFMSPDRTTQLNNADPMPTLTADRIVRRGDNENERYLEAILSAIAHDHVLRPQKLADRDNDAEQTTKAAAAAATTTTTTTGAQRGQSLVANIEHSSYDGDNKLETNDNESAETVTRSPASNNCTHKHKNDNNSNNNSMNDKSDIKINDNNTEDNNDMGDSNQGDRQQAPTDGVANDALILATDQLLSTLSADNVATPGNGELVASSATITSSNGFDLRADGAHFAQPSQLSMTTLGGALNNNNHQQNNDVAVDDFITIPRHHQQHDLASAPTFASSMASPLTFDANYPKRQIRFHRCYFNPISCFRKR